MDALGASLGDKGGRVRSAAIEALGSLSDPAKARSALPALESIAAGDSSERIRGAASRTIKAIEEGKPLRAEVGGKNIAIVREGPAFRAFALPAEGVEDAALSFSGSELERVPVRVEYWFAWKEAYPDTAVAQR